MRRLAALVAALLITASPAVANATAAPIPGVGALPAIGKAREAQARANLQIALQDAVLAMAGERRYPANILTLLRRAEPGMRFVALAKLSRSASVKTIGVALNRPGTRLTLAAMAGSRTRITLVVAPGGRVLSLREVTLR